MKSLNVFSLAVLGLSLFSCSKNEIETGKNLSQNGVVEIKIASPNIGSRALVDATSGNNNEQVNVNGTITVKLTYGSGETKTETVQANGEPHTVKFWGVTNPTKVEAYINDGEKVSDAIEITNSETPNMQAIPSNIPAYGSTETITLAGKTETNDGKTYEMYKATVDMKIPVARIEVSGIKHEEHSNTEDDKCKYSKLTIDGIYLDGIYVTRNAESVTDYKYPADPTGSPGAPILWDAITAPNDFLASGVQWPSLPDEGENKKAYSFNFYPNKGNNDMPILKIYFAEAQASDESNPVSSPRYAIIKSYNGNTNFKFEAGKIYRITDIILKDENIIGDEGGNALYGVDVTVKEAKWTIVDTTAEWVE